MEFVAKKVSKLNGDVRVAFDLMKSSLAKLLEEVKLSKGKMQDAKIIVTLDHVIRVFEEKYGSKIKSILQKLGRNDMIVINIIIDMFDDIGEEKKLDVSSLIKSVGKRFRLRGLEMNEQ
jgi:hypothetical protein